SYLRNGNQTVFGSDEYPNLNISGSGVKTALGNIACAGATIAAEFTLGTLATAPVGQYNFENIGSMSIISGGNNKFDFGSATAKRVDFQGGITAYAPLVITGTGLAHYVAVGDVLDFNASSIVHSTGQGTTFDYYGINMGILDNNKIVYENLILSGSGNYTLQNGGILDVNKNLVVESGVTLSIGGSQSVQATSSCLIPQNVTIAGNLFINNTTPQLNYFKNLNVLSGGRFASNANSTIFLFKAINIAGVLSITGRTVAGDQCGVSCPIFSSGGTVFLDDLITNVNTDFNGDGAFLVNGNTSISGATTLRIATTSVVTLAGATNGTSNLNGLNATTSRFVLAPDAAVEYRGQTQPMITGIFNVSATGSTFLYYSRINTYPQVVYPTTYYNLGSLGSGLTFKSITNSFRVLGNATLTGSRFDFATGCSNQSTIFEGNVFANNIFNMVIPTNHNLVLGGNINTFNSFSLNAANRVTYNRNGDQNIFPTSYPALSVTGTGNKSITAVTSVTSNLALNLSNGALNLNASDLVLATTANISGTFSNSNLILTTSTGGLIKKLASGVQNFTFPVGIFNGASNLYMPLNLNGSVNASDLKVVARAGVQPNLRDPSAAPTNHWKLSNSVAINFAGSITGSNLLSSPLENFYTGGFYNGIWDFANSSYNSSTNATIKYFPSATNINGDLTAAFPGSFNSIIVFPTTPANLIVCQGANLILNISSGGANFNVGNRFIAEVSTASGTWVNPIGIGTVVGTSINSNSPYTIPTNLIPGVYYVRTRATNPVYLSPSSVFTITVTGTPTNTTPTTQICANGTSIKNLIGTGGTQWLVFPSTVGGIVGNTFTAASILGVASFSSATVYNIVPGGCSSPGVAFTVNHKPLSLINNSDLCINTVKNLTPNGGSPWYNVGGAGSISGDNFVSSVAGIKTVMKISAAGCSSDGVNFNVTPNTAITNQPDDLTVGIGNNADFSVVVSGTAPFSYLWQRNGANINAAPSITGLNTSDLSILSVPLSLNNSLIRVSISGICGAPVISNVTTLTVVTIPNGTFRSNVASGIWENATNWQIFNGTIYVTATRYPNQFVTGDQVSISGGHLITHSTNITSTLNNITISGTLTGSGGTLRTGGILINSSGVLYNTVSPTSYLTGISGVFNNGRISSDIGSSQYVIQNGFYNGAGSHVSLNGNGLITFSVRDQLMSCNGCTTFNLPNVTIQGANTLTISSTIAANQNGAIGAVNTNGKLVIGANTTFHYNSNVAPMLTGNLDASNPNSVFFYIATNPIIKTDGVFYNDLRLTANTNATFSGFLNTKDFQMLAPFGTARLVFDATTPSTLLVSGLFLTTSVNGLDMSKGGLDHTVFCSGSVSGTTFNLIKGNGSFWYNGLTNQSVLGANYNNLLIDNPSLKSLVANTTIAGLTITGASTLSTQQFSITGGAGIMQMDAGSTLELGSGSSTNNIPMVAMTSTDYLLDPASTVVFQTNGNQTINNIAGAGYGNVVIRNSGLKSFSNTLTSVYGNVTVTSGAVGRLTSFTSLSGDLVNNGTIDNGSFLNFAGLGNDQYLRGTSPIVADIFMLTKTLAGGNVILNNNIKANNLFLCNTGCGLASPNLASVELNNFNLSLTGSVLLFNGTSSIISSGDYTGGSVFINGSTSGQYLNKVIPFSGSDGYSPVTIVGLAGSGFGANSSLELKYISTISGNATSYAEPSLFAKTNNITNPVLNFKMDYTNITGSPKSVYYYTPARTTVTGSFVDNTDGNFGVGGNTVGVNGTYVAEGQYFEPSIYRTAASGVWNDIDIWERFNGISWLPATTLPGMAVAGDQVLITPGESLQLNITPAFALQSMTISGSSDFEINGSLKNLTITGELVGAGNFNLSNSAHNVFFGDRTNSFSGSLNQDGSGSTFHMYGTGNLPLFNSVNYPNLRILSTGGSRTFSPVTAVKCENLYIAPSSMLEFFGPAISQELTISGVTSIAGTLRATGSWNITYLDKVNIGVSGVMQNATFTGSAQPTNNIYDDFLNYGTLLSGAFYGNYFKFFGNGKTLFTANDVDFNYSHMEIYGDQIFNTSPTANIINRFGGITVFTGASLTNKGNLIDNDVLSDNANASATFVNEGNFVCGSSAAISFTTGQFISTFVGSNFTYNRLGTQTVLPRNYYNLSISGSGIKTVRTFSMPPTVNVLGNLSINAATLSFTGTTNYIIQGDILGNGGIQFGTANSTLTCYGNFNNTGTYIDGISNQLIYASINTQNVKAGNFNSTVKFEGNNATSQKTLMGNATFAGIVMNGAVVNLGVFNLVAGTGSSVFSNTVPYSNTNMIRQTGLLTGGYLEKQGNGPGQLIMVYPTGTGNIYSPISIIDVNGVNTGDFVRMKVIDFPSVYTNYVKRYTQFSSNFIPTSRFQFAQFFDPTDVVGNPLEVHFNNNTTAYPQGVISLVDNYFGVTATGSNTLAGDWAAYSVPNKLYRSIATGNWGTNLIWEFSLDNGGTWQTVTGGNYPGSTPLEKYDVIVQPSHTVSYNNVALQEIGNVTVSGFLNCGTFDFNFANSTHTNETVIDNTGLLTSSGVFAFDNVRIASGGQLFSAYSSFITQDFYGDIQNEGILNFPSSKVRFRQNLSKTNFNLSGTGVYFFGDGTFQENANIFNYASQLTIAGAGFSINTAILRWNQGIDSYLNYQSNNLFPDPNFLVAGATGNTVEFGGDNQTIQRTTYYHLVLSTQSVVPVQKGLRDVFCVTANVLGDFSILNNNIEFFYLNSCASPFQVNGNVLGTGSIDFNAYGVMYAKGDFLCNGAVINTGGQQATAGLYLNGNVNQQLSGIHYQTNVFVQGGSTKTLLGNATIGGVNLNDNELILQSGLLDVGNNKLTIYNSKITDEFSSVSNFNPTKSLLINDNSIVAYKAVAAGGSFTVADLTIPQSDGAEFTAVFIKTTPTTTFTKITPFVEAEFSIKNIKQKAPNQNNDANSLNRYWQIDVNNINAYSGEIYFGYAQNDAIAAAEPSYRVGRWDGSTWTVSAPTSVDEINNLGTIDGVSFGGLIGGNYTVGPNSAFTDGSIYSTTGTNSAWDIPSSWVVSNNNGVSYVAAGNWPGEIEAGDRVIIKHSINNVNTITILPLGGLTISGSSVVLDSDRNILE
ncbi:MAG: hypothetical protein ACKVOU_13650, partial [Cytophagales bacterium]